MSTCLVYYATSEGQTAKIARRIADRLATHGIAVEVVEAPADVDPARFDAVLVGDSIHIGHYHRKMRKFLRKRREGLAGRPSGFFSVCLSIASKNEEDRAAARGLVDEMIEDTGWHPDRVAIFAGTRAYTRYGPLTRWVMKRIAAKEGADTDTSRDHEYTDWRAVDAFADAFADDLAGAHATAATRESSG
jgi:menaquinone-dependent protoporphyrinogen oxidase